MVVLGKFIQKEEAEQLKEERKIIAGYSSGRKTLGVGSKPTDTDAEDKDHATSAIDDDDKEDGHNVNAINIHTMDDENTTMDNLTLISLVVPAPVDGGVIPSMEWWDEAYLPKLLRENRKKSRAAAEQDDFQHLALHHTKTYKYIQHPIAIKALGGLEKNELSLPMYLTKKER